jgi:myosin heavy subunit
MGQGNNKAFVAALFWAFEVKRSTYKLGHTRVFFKSGQLSQLDHILQQASEWSNSSNPKMKKERARIAKRFRLYYIRVIWRRAYIKVVAVNRFLKMLDGARKRSGAAIRLQSFLRMVPKRVQHLRQVKAIRRAAMLSAERARDDAEAKAKADQEAREVCTSLVSGVSGIYIERDHIFRFICRHLCSLCHTDMRSI